MILVLDGYNILKKIKHTSYISDTERQKFIKQLNHYAHQKKLSLILVFDGGPFQWPATEKISTYLTVVYSGTRETADDYIKQYLEEHKGADLLLVSSDRELVQHAHQFHTPSLDSYEFSHFLQTMENPIKTPPTKTDHQTKKLTERTHNELDALMEQLKIPNQKSEDVTLQKKRSSQKLSKKERQILQKIKKL